MTTNENKANEAALRHIFRTMNAHQAQEIPEACYKAIEGLQSLAEALEIADARQSQCASPLPTEHFFAIEAIEAMK